MLEIKLTHLPSGEKVGATADPTRASRATSAASFVFCGSTFFCAEGGLCAKAAVLSASKDRIRILIRDDMSAPLQGIVAERRLQGLFRPLHLLLAAPRPQLKFQRSLSYWAWPPRPSLPAFVSFNVPDTLVGFANDLPA